ncbi:cyclic nucleotide-binding domain-containing protein [Nisaea sp.]|uniref:cyclic nucleotide-binding domain-containing protein n=1 Tax=Nisaea sp. TaxID=2024842 RepID=UPI0032978CF1
MVPESDRIEFDSGDVICEHGDPSDYVMYVLSGEIAMEHSPGLYIELDGKVTTFKRGALLGESSAILKRPYASTLVGFSKGAYARVRADRIRADIAKCAKLPKMIILNQAHKLNQAYSFIMNNYKNASRSQVKEIFEPNHSLGDFFEEGVAK